MSREWMSEQDQRWQMRCDGPGCSVRSEPFEFQPPLSLFAARGWFIARLYGDLCPTCRTKGHPEVPAHDLMSQPQDTTTTSPHLTLEEAPR